MKNNFEVTGFVATSVPGSVDRSVDLKSAVNPAVEEGPTYEEIQKRAYELYLKSREEFSAQEYWLLAEEGLRQEQAKRREPIPPKGKTGKAGAASLAKSDKNR